MGRTTSSHDNKSTTKNSSNSLYCVDCFANIRSQCICSCIEGYDLATGIPIVSISEEEWEYLLFDLNSSSASNIVDAHNINGH
jgi:hypothetical protein